MPRFIAPLEMIKTSGQKKMDVFNREEAKRVA
jgi:hypothetical protein